MPVRRAELLSPTPIALAVVVEIVAVSAVAAQLVGGSQCHGIVGALAARVAV